MGLNALITRNVAGYVKSFRVHGKLKENDSEECAKVGRVPDGSMMLTTLIRAAIDRMPLLENFRYISYYLVCRHELKDRRLAGN